MILTTLSELQRAAYEADNRFRLELQRVYGSRASEARYYQRHTDHAVQRAADAKVMADSAFLDKWLSARTSLSNESAAKG